MGYVSTKTTSGQIKKLWDLPYYEQQQLELQQKEELGIFWMPHIIFEFEGIVYLCRTYLDRVSKNDGNR